MPRLKKTSTIKEISKEDLIYIAALLDHKGDVELYKTKDNQTVQKVIISSSYIETINYLTSKIGDFYLGRNTKIKKAIIDRRPQTWVNKNMYISISAKVDIIKFLDQILPYLRIKKRKAEIMLDYLKGGISRNAAVIKIKNMKNRGYTLDEIKEKVKDCRTPAHKSILNMLMVDNEICQSEMIERTKLPKSTISYALNKFRIQGLITIKRRGMYNTIILNVNNK